jgi:ribonuclease Y
MPEPAVFAALASAAAGVATGLALGRWRRWQDAVALAGRALMAEADAIRRQAEEEARQVGLAAELSARETAMQDRAFAETENRALHASLEDREAAVAVRDMAVSIKAQELEHAAIALGRHEARVVAREAEVAEARGHIEAVQAEAVRALEASCGERAAEIRASLAEAELDETRRRMAQTLRTLDAQANDSDKVKYAKRIMGISVGRFYGHYLTERHQSFISLCDPRTGAKIEIAPEILTTVSQVTGITMALNEAEDTVRLEGQDGVGREVTRRVMARLLKRPSRKADEVKRLVVSLKEELDHELVALGRRAFADLQIPRAHPEIVMLVGRLNYRTSHTQNQWKHAIEAAFLCGMMADELGLDVKLARRAALMHDIGKALTHELDGSHAVIGADYARRLGEPEVVANAIGAHHTDEPFSSPYAFLVAAGDAMSGARPGARRQTEETYGTKIADLERLSRGFREVDEAFVVQGGREVRVYVNEAQVDDLGAVDLSGRIARSISEQLTFPGQIRVTVIREFRAEESAG